MLYRPFAYSNAKYGAGHALRQQWLGDLPVILLAVVPSGPLGVSGIAAIIILFVSFVCVYELGYYENDHVAAIVEQEPTPPSDAGGRYRVGWQAWGWFAVLSLIAILLLQRPISAWVVWFGFGLVVRLLFFAYNKTAVGRRVLLYPLLQASKSFGFLILFPVNPVGVSLLLAHVLKRTIAYAIYRLGGHHRRFPMHAAGVLLFVMITAALMAGSRDAAPLSTTQYWLIVGWCVARGGKEFLRREEP